MEINEAVSILKLANLWRQDNEGIYKMPNPKELGIAIDVVVEYFSTDIPDVNNLVCPTHGTKLYKHPNGIAYCSLCDYSIQWQT